MKAHQKGTGMTEEEYDAELDELYGEIQIGCSSFRASEVLRTMDPVAYKCGKADFENGRGPVWVCAVCGDEFAYENNAELCCSDKKTEAVPD